LDALIHKLKTSSKELNFDEVEGMLGPFHRHYLLFGIANYVYPSSWQFWREQVNGNSRIRLTFGIHPHMTVSGVSSRMWRDLHQLIKVMPNTTLGNIFNSNSFKVLEKQ
jgi:hypothetical protein